MKVLLACDKFKGSLDSYGVNTALARGLKKKYPEITPLILPMADGGDGTLAVLKEAFEVPYIYQKTTDPLGRSITAPYLKNKKTAYFELAAASGISLLKKNERQPLRTTTLGTGRMMRKALKDGATRLVLGLGGSCTTDAGLGIAYELGVRFYDKNKNELIPAGGNLLHIVRMDLKNTIDIDHLKILSDVPNPLYGPDGAAHVFARQKGATDKEIDLLDQGLRHVARLIKTHTGRSIDKLEGGGAAGGIAAGLVGLFGAEVKNGFEYLKNLTNLETEIKKADLVITGEGQLDKTSLNGKVVGGVAALCRQYQKPLVLVVGMSKLSTTEKETLGIREVYTVLERAGSVGEAMENTVKYLEEIGGGVKLTI